MTPAALYLRYSSDRQNERSPEDQEAICRPYMERLGFAVVAVYVDRAKSGATVHQRADFQRMLGDAGRGLFKAVCAETTSRYGRDEEDRAAARKRLTFHNVDIYTTADGKVSRIIDGIKAAIDANTLEDLKRMTWRGLAAVVRNGRFAGGAIYGYRSVPGRAGVLEIVQEEAAIIRRIFREYLTGASCRAIAARLNAEGVAAPRAGYWRASTICGHTRRKTGILQNELYCGRIIWNRAYRVRDPDTKRRIWRYNSEDQWQRSEAPHLRIIDETLFDEAQRRRASRAQAHGWQARPRRLLSGLLRCGACGAAMAKKDNDHGRPRIVCSRMLEGNACSNRRRYYLDDIEARVIGGLREQLGSEAAIDYFLECYRAERRKVTASVPAGRKASLGKELAAVEQRIGRAVQAVIDGHITNAEANVHLPGLRARRDALATELSRLTAPPIAAEPDEEARAAWLSEIATLEERGAAEGEASPLIRQMIESVAVEAIAAPDPPSLTVSGDLGPIIAAGRPSVGVWSGAG